MTRKKKSKKKETVQATLGDVTEPEKKPPQKKAKTTSKKKTAKAKPQPKSDSSKKKSTPKKKPKAEKATKKPSKEKTPPPKEVESGPSLTALPGVGTKLAERLIAAKYDSVEKISRSRFKSLAKKVDGLSSSGAKKLIAAAKEALKESSVKEAEPEIPSDAPADAEEIVSPTGPKLTDLPGVGAKLAKELERSGYNSIARLSRSRPASVARVVDGLSERKATTLVDAAIELMREAELMSVTEVVTPKTPPQIKGEPAAAPEVKVES
ncbi:MAG: helix-hairpin-helix domain-containing protein, partial [Candidatus Hodarchaeota archaeon]